MEITKETQKKISQISALLINEKIDLKRLEHPHFACFCSKLVKTKLGLAINAVTIKVHLQKLKDEIENQLQKPQVPISISVRYSDGSKFEYGLYSQVDIFYIENFVEKQSKDCYNGLFNYSPIGNIIRLGKYKGCNINDKSSIKSKFKSLNEILKWIDECLNPDVLNSLSTKRPIWLLQKDVETLNEFKKEILSDYAQKNITKK